MPSTDVLCTYTVPKMLPNKKRGTKSWTERWARAKQALLSPTATGTGTHLAMEGSKKPQTWQPLKTSEKVMKKVMEKIMEKVMWKVAGIPSVL